MFTILLLINLNFNYAQSEKGEPSVTLAALKDGPGLVLADEKGEEAPREGGRVMLLLFIVVFVVGFVITIAVVLVAHLREKIVSYGHKTGAFEGKRKSQVTTESEGSSRTKQVYRSTTTRGVASNPTTKISSL